MTSAAGWIIKARDEPQAQSALSRRRAALGPASAQQPSQPAPPLPEHLPSLPSACAPLPQEHHAPLSTAGLRSAAHPTLALALRSQARCATEGGCCRGDVGTVRGLCGRVGGSRRMRPTRGSREGGKAALSSEMCSGESRGALEARIRGGGGRSTSPASGERRQMRSPDPSVASRASGKGREGKGLPERADKGGRVAGGCRAELSSICRGALRTRKGQIALSGASGWNVRGPAKSPAVRPFTYLLFSSDRARELR